MQKSVGVEPKQPLGAISCKTVLCWVGSTEEPNPAAGVAHSLANLSGGQCHVVMALDTPHRRIRPGAPLTPRLISHAGKKLAELYGGRTMVLPGHPVREIRRYAKTHNVDLIVMGEQALNVESNYGEQLADQSPCTVMILRSPSPQRERK